MLAFAFLIPNPDEDSAKTSPNANANGGSSNGTLGLQRMLTAPFSFVCLFQLLTHCHYLLFGVRFFMRAVNEDGAAATLGRNPPSHSNGRRLHYCGRAVGTVNYEPAGGCGKCDGVCGPENGCQCRACYKLDN